jgi:hypothetical protein
MTTRGTTKIGIAKSTRNTEIGRLHTTIKRCTTISSTANTIKNTEKGRICTLKLLEVPP